MAKTDRLTRESETLKAMLFLYCRGQHGGGTELCAECRELQDYALERLEKCPFQQGKTTCARCPIHCYRANMREHIRMVMRYTGPRMPLAHPLMALRHTLDSLRKEPRRPVQHPPSK
jgi:hypothetical protein